MLKISHMAAMGEGLDKYRYKKKRRVFTYPPFQNCFIIDK